MKDALEHMKTVRHKGERAHRITWGTLRSAPGLVGRVERARTNYELGEEEDDGDD